MFWSKRIMQRWQWETCKMFIYMSFPVACFHYFNSPQIYEEYVTEKKLKSFAPTPPERREKLENIIREINAERQEKLLKDLEANRNVH